MNPLSRLGSAFLRDQPQAAAQVLEDFPADSVARYLASVSRTIQEEVLQHFSPGYAAAFLLASAPARAGELLARLPPDLQVMMLRRLERPRRETLLETLPSEQAIALRRLLPYAEGTAGALMDATLASLPAELSVRHAIKRVKRMRRGAKFYLYVTNSQSQLMGVLTLHELINATPSDTVAQVMHTRVISLGASDPLRSVNDSPYWQEFHALPVTDENQVLLGVIRHKTLRRFQEQAPQRGAVSGSLNTFMAVGELFSVSAGHLLSTLIATGKTLQPPERHD